MSSRFLLKIYNISWVKEIIHLHKVALTLQPSENFCSQIETAVLDQLEQVFTKEIMIRELCLDVATDFDAVGKLSSTSLKTRSLLSRQFYTESSEEQMNALVRHIIEESRMLLFFSVQLFSELNVCKSLVSHLEQTNLWNRVLAVVLAVLLVVLADLLVLVPFALLTSLASVRPGLQSFGLVFLGG